MSKCEIPSSDGVKNFDTKDTYYLQGVVCHIGKSLVQGHYVCYILEKVQSTVMYHLLSDKHHRVVGEVEFLKDVNLNGYIFLYGKKKVQSFCGNPYSGHRTEFLTLEKKYLHTFKKVGLPRDSKAPRRSDIGLQSKTQLSQLLEGTPLTIFDSPSSQESNSIEEITLNVSEEPIPSNSQDVNDVKENIPGVEEIMDEETSEHISSVEGNQNPNKLIEINESELDLYPDGKSSSQAVTVLDAISQVPYAATPSTKCSVIANFKISYRQNTLEGLSPGKWLNDCAINYFFSCLFISIPKENIITIDSLLIGTIHDDPSKLRGVLESKMHGRNIKELKHLHILIPFNITNSHWFLGYLQSFNGVVKIYDSMISSGLDKKQLHFVNEIMNDMDAIMLDNNNGNWNPPELKVEIIEGLPQQRNGYDCGLYACMYAKLCYREENLSFGATFISSLRTFLYDHFLRSQQAFITFEENIWRQQHTFDEIPHYGE